MGAPRNPGQAELELGQHLEAARHFAYALSVPIPPDVRTMLEGALGKARKHVASYRVTATPAGAEVVLDGEVVGKAPLAMELFVAPGEHTLSVRVDGQSGPEVEVRGEKGLTRAVRLVGPGEPLPPDEPTVPTADEAEGTKRSGLRPPWVALIAGGGLTTGAAVLGIAFRARASRAGDDLRGAQAEAGDNLSACVNSEDSALCRETRSAANRRADSNKVALGGFIGAGLLGVGTLTAMTWLTVREKKRSARESRAVRVGVTPRRRGMGVGVWGAF